MKLSIQENESVFLDKIVTFEKRRILQHYFKNGLSVTRKEMNVLKKCHSSEIETIALVGVLLREQTPLNIFRLRIGSTFKSDSTLAKACQELINIENIEQAEGVLFHYEYEYNEDIEVPIIDFYIQCFKKS